MRMSATYEKYPFTEAEVKQAYQTSILDLAQQYGYRLKDEGRVFRVEGNGGLFIWANGLGWYHSTTYDKGNNVDFLIKYCNVNTKLEAIKLLLDYAHITPVAEMNKYIIEEKKQFALPEKGSTYKNMYAYLINKRCIDKEIVYAMQAQKKLYQDNRYNCVFVAYNSDNVAKYASVRGTGEAQYRGDIGGSDKSYGFNMPGKSNIVFVFESPIDAMSHATLTKLEGKDWTEHNRLSLGGTSDIALDRYLIEHPDIKQIVFCLDNDYKAVNPMTKLPENHGQNAIKRMAAKYSQEGYIVKKQVPTMPFKDFNEQLVSAVCPSQDRSCDQDAELSAGA